MLCLNKKVKGNNQEERAKVNELRFLGLIMRELPRLFCIGFLVTLETGTGVAALHSECGVSIDKAERVQFSTVCTRSRIFSGPHELYTCE